MVRGPKDYLKIWREVFYKDRGLGEESEGGRGRMKGQRQPWKAITKIFKPAIVLGTRVCYTTVRWRPLSSTWRTMSLPTIKESTVC